MMAALFLSASIFPATVDMPWSMSMTDGQLEERVVIGQTYPIIEPDALEEIEARVAKTRFDPKVFGEEGEWSALQSPHLPDTEIPERRIVVPFFALTFDIPDKDGNILYPAGYTFNPLEYLTLPSRLIIVAEDQVEWALSVAETADMIILAGSNALEATREHGRPIFKLEDRVRERLDLRSVPSVVEQHGKHFVVDEIPVVAPYVLIEGHLPSFEVSGGSDD